MPRKTFTPGEVLTASDVNTLLMDQSVMTFASSAARGSAIPSPTEGMVTYLEDSKNVEVFDGTNFSSISSTPSGNAIINGAFEINQRNFTSTTATDTFLFDRFINFNQGGTSTFSAQTFTPGAAPVVGYEATNYLRVVTSGQSAAGDGTQVRQSIESVRTFAGQTISVSFFARANTGTPSLAVEAVQSFGSGGSTAVFAAGGKQAINTSWNRYSYTINIPSISGKTIGANNQLQVRIWLSAGTDFSARLDSLGIQSNTFEIWGLQAEAGSVATPFKRNANSLQGELAACQRYFEVVESFNVAGTAASTSVGLFNCYLKVRKRTNPTISFKSTTYAFDRTGIDSKTGTGQNSVIAAVALCVWNVTGSSGLTIGNHLVWNGGNVEFSSEL